jgi:hypothetical protein
MAGVQKSTCAAVAGRITAETSALTPNAALIGHSLE